MIDCKSAAKIRKQVIIRFVRNWKSTLQIPACLVLFLKIVTSLYCRDPNGANAPEVLRCVGISWLVSQFVVYIVVDLYTSSFVCVLLVYYVTCMLFYVFPWINAIILLLKASFVDGRSVILVVYHAGQYHMGIEVFSHGVIVFTHVQLVVTYWYWCVVRVVVAQ